jgi:3-deoxy-D-manno-octulosonate 8-phosphate phosphatase (KDO 8-P phosphatase)
MDMPAEARAANVRLLILDVDGVLTDGRLYFGPHGETLKVFHVRDGHGIKLLREAGIEVAILSSRHSEMVAARARELGLARVLQGQADKIAGYERLLAVTGTTPAQCAYMGDDWPDLDVLTRVGFAATVADAAPEVRKVSHWVAPAAGGRGAVRQLAEFILRAQNRFDAALARHRTGAARA